MKKIYYSVILSLAFSLFSCSDFLDRESLSELSNGNFLNTMLCKVKVAWDFAGRVEILVVCVNWNLLRITAILPGFRGWAPM